MGVSKTLGPSCKHQNPKSYYKDSHNEDPQFMETKAAINLYQKDRLVLEMGDYCLMTYKSHLQVLPVTWV